jgi:hypothetical protein
VLERCVEVRITRECSLWPAAVGCHGVGQQLEYVSALKAALPRYLLEKRKAERTVKKRLTLAQLAALQILLRINTDISLVGMISSIQDYRSDPA